MKKIVFLGGGNMATAIISGLHRLNQFEIHVIEKDESKRLLLQTQYQVATYEKIPDLTDEDILFLAIKPQDIEAASKMIDTNGALILSIAAGLPINILSLWFKSKRIIRIMPNTPAQVGLGISGIYAGSNISQEDKDIAQQIMQSVGNVYWQEQEDDLHSITAVSGSGPAYVFYLLNALSEAAEKLGFNHNIARELSLNTFKGAIELAEQSGLTFSELQKNVTSKGGTTFTAISSFEQNHLNDIINQGVQACKLRSIELGEKIGHG